MCVFVYNVILSSYNTFIYIFCEVSFADFIFYKWISVIQLTSSGHVNEHEQQKTNSFFIQINYFEQTRTIYLWS